jgi:putative DNA primase/helicase
MLVLHGAQGAGKTSFVRVLYGREFSRSQLESLEKKDASQGLCGFWAVELDEMDRILRGDQTVVKGFITRVFDDYRAPYERTQGRYPRECVLIGTTNDDEFLVDPTGARRYWPIPADQVDLTYLGQWRDAIWGEALALAEEGSHTLL